MCGTPAQKPHQHVFAQKVYHAPKSTGSQWATLKHVSKPRQHSAVMLRCWQEGRAPGAPSARAARSNSISAASRSSTGSRNDSIMFSAVYTSTAAICAPLA